MTTEHSTDNASKAFALLSLPEQIHPIIISFLNISELKALGTTCRAIQDIITNPLFRKNALINYLMQKYKLDGKGAVMYRDYLHDIELQRYYKEAGKNKVLIELDIMTVGCAEKLKVHFPHFFIKAIENFIDDAAKVKVNVITEEYKELLKLGFPILSILLNDEKWRLAQEILEDKDIQIDILEAEKIKLQELESLKSQLKASGTPSGPKSNEYILELISNDIRKSYRLGYKPADFVEYPLDKMKALTSSYAPECYKMGYKPTDFDLHPLDKIKALTSWGARICYTLGYKPADFAEYPLDKIKDLTSQEAITCYKLGYKPTDLAEYSLGEIK